MKNDDDKYFRSILKKNLPEHLPSPWFTKTVLNRLPERKVRIAARIEYGVYLLALVAILIFAVFTTRNVYASGVVRVGDIIVYLGEIAMTAALCWMLIAPFVERMKKNG